tara:strand:- start:63 stop:638 length:576 start_codon:yes stop_codon:yes gene_type:complete
MEKKIELIYQLYNDLDFKQYQEESIKVWEEYINEKISEFYSEEREIDGDDYDEDNIKVVEYDDEGDSEDQSFYMLSYEGGEMTNGFLSTSDKFEHGFYCNELKLEFNWGEDGDIICYLPPFGTFKNNNENFFIINYPEKYEEFEFINRTSTLVEGDIEKIYETLSKFHFIEFKDLPIKEDGKIHTDVLEKS